MDIPISVHLQLMEKFILPRQTQVKPLQLAVN